MDNKPSLERGHIDWLILLPALALLLFSIAFVYSASAPVGEARMGGADKLFWNHTIRAILGIVIMFTFMKIDYHFWQKISLPMLVLSIALLVGVFLFGTRINNAYRWLNFGFFNFQPSEFAKFALVAHIAALISQRKEVIKSFKFGLMPLLVWTGAVCVLIALQPNMSTAVVIFLISFAIMFIGGTNVFHLIITGISAVFLSGIYALLAPYRRQRLFAYMGMSEGFEGADDPDKFQITQAILAFGNGGATGVGPGQSRQSHLFLPESYGDFIFSIIGEEYGFIGAVILIAIFLFIIIRGLKTVKNAPDEFGYLLSAGILITIGTYAAVSAAVNSGLLPTTGLPMPLVSYGGTAVLFYSAAIGIFLNISAQSGVYPKRG
jgi:cell division protein FtsW